MLERRLLWWLILSSLAALAWPHSPFAGWGDPFVAGKSWLPALIALTMFAIGLMLPRDEVRQVAERWPVVFGGTAVQYLSMPALAYVLGRLFQLDGEFMIGVIMVGCVPGAMASNVLTLNARGNASYSVSLTASATLLSPLAVPLALGATLAAANADAVRLMLRASGNLMITVVVPVVAGHLLGRRLDARREALRRVGAAVANLAILWIIAVVVGLNRDRLTEFHGPLVAALLAVNLGGYAAGYAAGRALRLPWAMRKALTLEIGMQNAGLGATLATQLFPHQPAIAIAPAMYTFGCMLTGTALARWWAGLEDRRERAGGAAAAEPSTG